jgi:hypothetical protein
MDNDAREAALEQQRQEILFDMWVSSIFNLDDPATAKLVKEAKLKWPDVMKHFSCRSAQ